MPIVAVFLGLAAFALALSALATPVVIRFCRRYEMLDRPNRRKVHAHGVPRLGGAALFIALTLGLLLAYLAAQMGWLSLTAAQLRLVPVIYLGLCGFFVIGFADDLRSLPAMPRLVAQLGVALAVVLLSGGIIRINSFFGQVLLPPWLAVAVTVIWIAGIVNTFNWIDGLDGLSAGIGSISTLAFLILALCKPALPNAALTVVLCLLLAGALSGFLIYNFHPAKIFIGDGGAFSLGYMLAVISVVGLYKQAAVITFLLPLLILALPIGDTLFAVARRLVRGQPITRPDNRHIHHRILALMSREYRARLSNSERDAIREELQVNPAHRNTVLALYTFAAVFAGIAVIVGIRA